MIALLAVGLLVATVFLFRRRKSSGWAAAVICLVVSIGLHAAILLWVPRLRMLFSGGGMVSEQKDAPGEETVSVAVFAPDLAPSDFSADQSLADELAQDELDESDDGLSAIAPLSLGQPIVELTTSPVLPTESSKEAESDQSEQPTPSVPVPGPDRLSDTVPASLASTSTSSAPAIETDDLLGDWLSETLAPPDPSPPASKPDVVTPGAATSPAASSDAVQARTAAESVAASQAEPGRASAKEKATHAFVPGRVDEDFAARQGAAKTEAIRATGGDADTEAAVAAALKYLTAEQRSDGAWDPLSSGAGRERAPLGLQRESAGKRAETGITGLALLALLGSGNTHQSGEHRDNVYRGLVYLLQQQRGDGSLAGNASIYAAHYCHAMAGLSLAECSAMTGDAAAIEATRRAIAYSKLTQHPLTGGWRYTRGDKGDMSQIGWQAMLIDGAWRSGALERDTPMRSGVSTFLATVRSGRAGGLASYRPGERPSATMTAEALATRLLMGEDVPPETIREAERVLLDELPGQTAGPDNYYYWYYATLALHQLQDDAWRTWNAAMKQRLLATQRPDGSWPDTTLWGGYGGTVYTTAMATLCLETYYRHQLRR